MKLQLLLICLLISVSSTAMAQRVNDPEDDGIDNNSGCHYRDGHIGIVFKGRVIKIIDGDSAVFLGEKGEKKKVNLLSVDASSSNGEARAFLEGHLLNKDVTLIVSSGQIKNNKVNGVFEIDDRNINAYLLELGLARLKDADSYQISVFNFCLAEKAAQKAQDAKLGIWAK